MTAQSFNDFFVEIRSVPGEWEDSAVFLDWYLEQIVNSLNSKSGGTYFSQILPTGNKIAIGSKSFDILRKTFNFGPLPNNTTKSVAHGITVGDTFRIFNIYLSANDPTDKRYFCTQNYSLTSGNMVRLEIDATNVNVTTNGDYTAYSDCFVIVEYFQ